MPTQNRKYPHEPALQTAGGSTTTLLSESFTLEEDSSTNRGVDGMLPQTAHHHEWLSPVLLAANDLRTLASIQSVTYHYQSPKGQGSDSVIMTSVFKVALQAPWWG